MPLAVYIGLEGNFQYRPHISIPSCSHLLCDHDCRQVLATREVRMLEQISIKKLRDFPLGT